MLTLKAVSGAEAGGSYAAPVSAEWGGCLGGNAIRLNLLVICRGVSRRREVAAATATASAVAFPAAGTSPAALLSAPTAAAVLGSMPCSIGCCPIPILPILIEVLPSLILSNKSLLRQNILASLGKTDVQVQHI